MVKLDYNKNYYAELEVTPKATLDEIKKQFRKLGKAFFLFWRISKPVGEKHGHTLTSFSAQIPSRQESGQGGRMHSKIPGDSSCS